MRHWFTSVINNFGMWNSGSLVLSNSQHLTIYFFSWQISQSYIKRFRTSVLFQKQEVDNPKLPSHLTPSGLLFILASCECVTAALCTVLRYLPQNLQIQHPKWAQHRSNLYRSWDAACILDGCVWECMHACLFVWVYQHSLLTFLHCAPAVQMTRSGLF